MRFDLSLNLKAWLGYASLAVAVGLLLFIPAGTLRYWQAWLFLAAFFAPAALLGVYLARHDPALMRRRLRGGPWAEKEAAQKIIMFVISIAFVGLLVVPALDHRFGWSNVPLVLVIAGDLLVVAGFYVAFLVYRENTSAAATIEVTPDQRVITTGPYAHLRHPQYAGALLYLGGTPLALDSFWGLLVFAALVPALVWRLLDEERLLARELPGYRAYQERVRWRLIPRIF
jgi:protein-S-isoprenylcysteine O-methyltransferase Ste14